MKRLILSLATAGLILVGTVRCGDVAETQYGSPSGLKSTNLPGEAGAPQLSCDAGIMDAGPIDPEGGMCPSWANDIYPNMQASGSWQCTSAACHGGGPATPPISAVNASDAYNNLQKYMVTGQAKPYFNPATSDPTKSAVTCNLSGMCGQGMPRAPGKQLTCQQFATVVDWVRCGAPNN